MAVGDVAPADGMTDRERGTSRQDFIGDSLTKIAEDTNVVACERRERPVKCLERFANDRDVFRGITEQMCAYPVHRSRVSGGEEQTNRQRLGREWSIALPGDDRVGDV